MAAKGEGAGEPRQGYEEGRGRSAELDFIVADSNVAWKWDVEVVWTNESDHAWLASRTQPHRAGGRACTPATLNILPREAFTDLRIRYRTMATLLGVEEPQGLSEEWAHDQPREEAGRTTPGMGSGAR